MMVRDVHIFWQGGHIMQPLTSHFDSLPDGEDKSRQLKGA